MVPAMDDSTVGKRLARIAISLILVVGWSASARAQNMVYHSPNDDEVDPGTSVQLPIGPSESLFLYLDAGNQGSQSGIACNDGDGRELCGYDVKVDAVGGANFVDFIPESGVVHLLTPTQLRANGLFATAPILGPVRIGELKVALTDEASEVVVTGGQVVLSALQIETIAQSVIADAPEPGFVSGLGWAILGMAAAARRRRAAGARRRLSLPTDG